MASTVDEYREAKMTYLRLRDQAKKDLLAQFQLLTNQLFQIQRELREDFGHKITIPTKPKAKRGKTGPAAAQGRQPSAPKTAPQAKLVEMKASPAKASPKVAALEKKLAVANAKLEQLTGAGKPTQAAKDKIYEIEDELRLARGE